MEILTVTLYPQESFSQGYEIEKVNLDIEGLEDEEVEELISEAVQQPNNSGFPRYGIALNKEQARTLAKEIRNFLKKNKYV